jgi:hypothetical protein
MCLWRDFFFLHCLVNSRSRFLVRILLRIQNTQNRDGAVVQAKLDELIRVSSAQNALIGIERFDGRRDFRDSREMPRACKKAWWGQCAHDSAQAQLAGGRTIDIDSLLKLDAALAQARAVAASAPPLHVQFCRRLYGVCQKCGHVQELDEELPPRRVRPEYQAPIKNKAYGQCDFGQSRDVSVASLSEE